MKKRYAAASLLLMFLLAPVFFQTASAQPAPAQTALLKSAQPPPVSLVSLFNRSAVPAEVWRLEGPSVLAVGEEGLFTAHANVTSATLPLRPRWDFGDGTTAQALATRHTFSEPGRYTVVFSLQNQAGTASDTLHVSVTEAGGETPPLPPPPRIRM